MRGIAAPIPNSHLWYLRAPFNDALYEVCKSTPGLRWQKGKGVWVGFRDAVSCAASRAAELGINVDVQDRPAFEIVGSAPPNVRDYQALAALFLLERGREGCILGDAMGLGKTCSALTAARNIPRVVVVCPSFVRGVWKRELPRWAPNRAAPFCPEGVKGRADFKIPSDVDTVVIHYDILHAWADAITTWVRELDARPPIAVTGVSTSSAVIFDEAHLLQNEKTARSKAGRAVAASCTYRWALSGTPLTNRPRDLWNVVDVISRGRLGSFFQFALRYCGAVQEEVAMGKVVWKFDGATNLEELAARTKEFMLRRTLADVALELPEKSREIVKLETGAKARHSSIEPSRAGLRLALDGIADGKSPLVWDLIRGHLEEGRTVVCFTWRRSMAERFAALAAEAGFTSACVHGAHTVKRRDTAIARAKGAAVAGDPALLSCTIDSTSVGIDLTFASVAVFAEIDYKPHALLQAEARLHRFGQERPVTVQYAIARGTIDEVIADRVVAKLDTFKAVIGDTGESLAGDLRGDEESIFADLIGAIESGKAHG